MRKLLTPLIIAVVLTGSAYALVVNLFPDNAEFPRVPAWDGTIGGTISRILGGVDLANYIGDGTVENTRTLSGLTATGYLQHNNCSGSDVWLSIRSNGIPNCGMTGSLLGMGTLTGVTGTITVFKADDSSLIGYNGLVLNPGDIVSTDVSSSGTIAFNDASIIRLDEDTTLELSSTGTNSDGQTVAEFILKNGDLWGRVLTSTGMNFSASGYIAGVRGTSISMEKSGASLSIAIIDSTIGGTGAATITHSGGYRASVSSGSLFTYNGGTPSVTIPGKDTLLAASPWIASNTIDDMEYLLYTQADIQNDPPIIQKAQDELYATMPALDNPSMCSVLTKDSVNNCTSIGLKLDDNPEFEAIPGEDLENDQKDARREFQASDIICKAKYPGTRYWPTKGGCVSTGTIWIADYTGIPDPTIVNLPSLTTLIQTMAGVNAIISPPPIAPLKGKDFVIDAATEELMSGGLIYDDGYFKQGYIESGSDKIKWRNPLKNLQGYYYLYNIISANGLDNDVSSVYVKDPLSGYLLSAPDNTSATGVYIGANTVNLKKSIYPGGVWKRKPISWFQGTIGSGITQTGQYIAYPTSQMDLRDKKVVLELDTIPTGAKRYLLDLGDEKYYLQSKLIYQTITSRFPGSTQICPSASGCTIDLSNKIISLPITKTPDKMIIGNIWNPSNTSIHLNWPIFTTIKKVTISQ